MNKNISNDNLTQNSNVKPLGYFKNVIIPVLCYSGLSGAIVGLLVICYNKLASFLAEQASTVYTFVRANPVYTPLFFVGLILLALLMHLLLKATPECKGSGVPRTEGVLRGLLTFRWLRILMTTIAASALSFFGGLSLGAEGPSIQLGATTAQGVGQVLKCRTAWNQYVLSGGAGTGLAVAFNAPLTGLIFVLEEVHKRVTPMIILSAGFSIFTGVVVSNSLSLAWGGQGIMFEQLAVAFEFGGFNFNLIWMMIVMGIGLGICSLAFNVLILSSNKFTQKYVLVPQWLKLIFAFVVCGALGLVWSNSIGSGHHLITEVGTASTVTWWILGITLIVKLFTITISSSSGATGGLFIPMLSVGALIGGMFGKVFVMLGLSESLYSLIVIISMSAFLSSCVKAPITGMVLICEISGQFNSFLYSGIAIFVSYFVAELFRQSALYDILLDRLVEGENKGKPMKYSAFEVTIIPKCFADGKQIRDILWPPHSTVKTIVRGEHLIVPSSDTTIKAGDILKIKCESYDSESTKTYITKMLIE